MTWMCVICQHCTTSTTRTTDRANGRPILLVRHDPTMPTTFLRLMWDEKSRQGGLLSAQTFERKVQGNCDIVQTNAESLEIIPCIHCLDTKGNAADPLATETVAMSNFKDENRFHLFRADGCIKVWREDSKKYYLSISKLPSVKVSACMCGIVTHHDELSNRPRLFGLECPCWNMRDLLMHHLMHSIHSIERMKKALDLRTLCGYIRLKCVHTRRTVLREIPSQKQVATF